jgi:hypothetical protein
MKVVHEDERSAVIRVGRSELASIFGCLLAQQKMVAWLLDGKDPGTWAKLVFHSKEVPFDLKGISLAQSRVAELLEMLETAELDAVEVEVTKDLIVTIAYVVHVQKHAIDDFLPDWKKLGGVRDVKIGPS